MHMETMQPGWQAGESRTQHEAILGFTNCYLAKIFPNTILINKLHADARICLCSGTYRKRANQQKESNLFFMALLPSSHPANY